MRSQRPNRHKPQAPTPGVDPWSETRPSYPAYTRPPYPSHQPPPYPPANQPAYQAPIQEPPQWMKKRRRRPLGCGCFPMLLLAVPMVIFLLIYLLAPIRSTVLMLGIDYAEGYSTVGRSDTIILTTVVPLEPYVGMLSIPRDLWVMIPEVGENRINTAHFFAEADRRDSGPYAAMRTIEHNFGVDVDYYLRIRFNGFKEVFAAMGGVDISLTEPMAGYPAGKHHLTANKALAFARSRQYADDFFRMEQGQLIMKSALRQMLNPTKWPRLPAVILATLRVVDTNIPIWELPRMGVAILRAGPDGIDSRTISRDMVFPFTTNQGANVLAPNWDQINPVLLEMFDQ